MQQVIEFFRKYHNLIRVFGFIILVTLIVTFFINCVYSPVIVVGDSMNPTLNENDFILVNSFHGADDLERFDIIVFPYKYNNKLNVIKRIIGMPGDTIEIKDNVIYINGEVLKEFYGYYDESIPPKYPDVAPVMLSFDEYFVMGDNRNISDDSRSNDIGLIKSDDIIGKAVFRLWPLNSFGSLEYQ